MTLLGTNSVTSRAVNAIIFLAPISGFDQVLSEDRSVNRLVSIYLTIFYGNPQLIFFIQQEDSVLLWKMICSNKLLANVELVLFLNKCDILEKKLRAGVHLAKYVKSFQDRSNDSETVQKCEPFSRRCFEKEADACP